MEDTNRELKKIMSSFKNMSRIKDCFYHKKEECQGEIIQTHSIQRNGRLSIIESEVNGNNSIYTFTSNTSSENHLIEELLPIGKKEASTFFGFCKHHDAALFSPIENFKYDGSDKHLFLHSYRSFAHSYHRKMEENKIYNESTSDFIKALPKYYIDIKRIGLEMGVREMSLRKEQLDYYIENEIYDELDYLVYEKKGLFPFAVSSAISPVVSYKHKPMNNHDDPTIPFSYPMLTFLPDEDSTFSILASFPDDDNAINLLNELDELPDLKLEKAITSLIVSNCENTFFSPLFWNTLSRKEKRKFLDEFDVNVSLSNTNLSRFQNSSLNFFDDRFEMKRLKTQQPPTASFPNWG